MKAFLLGAGVGSRLRPLTDRIPKCLVPVNGTPLLDIWLQNLARHGFTDVLLNTHHLAEQVEAFVSARKAALPRVTLFHEPRLLGSAGTVARNRAFVEGESLFLIAYADNLTDMDLGLFRDFHLSRRSAFTMGLFPTPEPEQCGIAQLDDTGRVVAFEEKPAAPRGNLANAGLYLADASVFDIIPAKPYPDFGYDVIPRLVGRMYGYPIPGYYKDLGTPDRLAAAQEEWRQRGHLPPDAP